MFVQCRPKRLNAVSTALAVGLFALPLAIALAVDPERTSTLAPEAQEPAAQAPLLHGRVTDAKGAPLADVRVRVAIPAADMRFVDATTSHTLLEAKSDAKGDYRLVFPGVTKATTISIDAMKPGYRRLVGTLMAGGDARSVQVVPGKEAEASLTLEPARHLAGVVYDEKGKPISGVSISADVVFPHGSAGVERTTSNRDGSFDLFNYSVDAPPPNEATKGVVLFSHPDYIALKFEDVYVLEPNHLKTLRIVLEKGRRLAGTVLDTAGKPVRNATIKVVSDGKNERKATLTDANGKFSLRGLGGGLTVFTARALPIKQKIELQMALREDKTDLEVRLQRISLPADLKMYAVLGMQLADVTPELKSAYDLYEGSGALILDPGNNPNRLQIGQLAEGHTFWMVGDTRVGNVREFVNQILAETVGQNAEPYSARVVYSLSTVEFDGTNTQFLKLTKDDLKQLKIVSDSLKAKSR